MRGFAKASWIHGAMFRTAMVWIVAGGIVVGGSLGARADARQEACKAAMNARIQVCTDDCTNRALAAASNYVDTNHNVKFGCLKGCALGQILQMRACAAGKDVPPGDPTETNR